MKTLVWIFLFLNGVFAVPYLSDPLSGTYSLTCSYSCYYDKYGNPHKGTDYQQYEGAPVYAAHNGYLIAHLMAPGNKGGNYIVLDNKNGEKSRYLHLKSFGPGIEAEKEVLVARGQIIGYMGNTGGPWEQNDGSFRSPVHLHFEAYLDGKAVDPYSEETFLWLKGLPIVFSCRTDFDFVSAIQQFDPQGFRYSNISASTFNNNTTPKDSSHLVTYPFQFGFTPVDYGDFTFNGLVFGLRKEADGGCWNVLDTGSIFLPNSANIFCVMELADISGSFQDNMVFYKDNVVWWETGYSPISSTNGNIWSCASMPIEANCFKQPGQYQVEAKIKHNGKEYSLAKRKLSISSTNSISSSSVLTRNKAGPNPATKIFNLNGRLIADNQLKGNGVFLFYKEKNALKKAVVIH
jgi:hypothetical protein